MTTDSAGNAVNLTYTAIPGTFGIEEQALDKIKVGPNPANDVITIFIPEYYAETDLSIALTDMNGKVLLSKKIQYSENLILDISFLDSGIFFYSIISETEKFVGKIIKQ